VVARPGRGVHADRMTGLATDARRRLADRRLVDRVLAGDRDAFRSLVDRESPIVLAVCRRILRDPTEAEDAAQEAFLTAYRKLGSYRGEGSFGAWLLRIAIREAHRRGRTRPAVDPLAPEAAAVVAALVDETDPGDDVVAAEHLAAIVAAIDALPAHFRDAVRMRLLDGLTYEQIATRTGRREATIRTHLHRGLVRLRSDLASEGRP
jgi:RNA polymerase sigma-70 factor, ECF subfamily